jgi:hypothetical protein
MAFFQRFVPASRNFHAESGNVPASAIDTAKRITSSPGSENRILFIGIKVRKEANFGAHVKCKLEGWSARYL